MPRRLPRLAVLPMPEYSDDVFVVEALQDGDLRIVLLCSVLRFLWVVDQPLPDQLQRSRLLGLDVLCLVDECGATRAQITHYLPLVVENGRLTLLVASKELRYGLLAFHN